MNILDYAKNRIGPLQAQILGSLVESPGQGTQNLWDSLGHSIDEPRIARAYVALRRRGFISESQEVTADGHAALNRYNTAAEKAPEGKP